MKKISIKIGVCLILLFTYGSCDEEFLERAPLNEASDVTFYKSASDAIAAVNAVYDIMQKGRMWKFEITVIGNRFNNDLGILPDPTRFPSEFQPTSTRRSSMWQFLYDGINRANIVLARVPPIEMDEALKTQLLGEATFLRGFYYFTLASYFGAVPIRLEPTTLENLASAKSSEADVVAQARQDMTMASSMLPLRSQQEAADIGRVTKGTAEAMLGRLELYYENWPAAITHFENVINSNEYELLDDYSVMFLAGGDNSIESIFEVQHAEGGGGWNDASEGSWMSGWNGTGTPGTINFGFAGGNQPNQDFVDNAYEPGDVRKDFTIVGPGDDYFGAAFEETDTPTGFAQRKYILPRELEDGAADSPINFHIIRYADVLLMYAEALNEANSGPTTAAYDAINEVRNRAELPDLAEGMSQQDFFEAIVRERRVELFMENFRTWDIIRWGLGPEILTPTRGFVAGRHERLPIPQPEIDANPLLEQNPDYQ